MDDMQIYPNANMITQEDIDANINIIELYINKAISMNNFGTFKVDKQFNIFAIGVVSAKKPNEGKQPTTLKNV